jgi:hypothetical protein
VAKFLKEKHGSHYMIYNLCSERGYNYSLFDHQVQGWCGFADHHAPPLALIFRLCKSIDDYLMQHEKNVVVVHCKAGKGRTGTISACYLLYCGLFSSANIALNYFAQKRSNNMFGVSSPAQRRYVNYSADIIANQSIPLTPRIILQQIILTCLPKLEMGAAEVHQEGELILEVWMKTQEKILVHRSSVSLLYSHDMNAKDAVIFTVNCMVQGDVQVDLYASKIGLLGKKSIQKICFIQFHTTMCGDGSTLVFTKQDCDKAAYDKRFPSNFQLCVSIDEVEECSLPYDTLGEDDIIPNIQSAKSQDGSAVFFSNEYATTELLARIREVRSFSSPLCEQIEKAGWLSKQGLTVRNWKDRWFVLKGDSISYFKSPKNTTPSGVILLQSIYTVSLIRDKKIEASQPYQNSLVLRTEERDYVVCAANVLELEEWAEAIHVASAQQHQHDLLLAPEIGKLFVVILGAENLMPHGVGGEKEMKPYCVANLSKQKYQTRTEAGNNPRFPHQVLEFNIHSVSSVLQITCWDENKSLAPRYCGQVTIPVEKIKSFDSPTAVWYPLMKRTELSLVSGSLHLLIYMNALTESADSFIKKVNLMAKANSEEFETNMMRVNSDDFLVVESEYEQNKRTLKENQ